MRTDIQVAIIQSLRALPPDRNPRKFQRYNLPQPRIQMTPGHHIFTLFIPNNNQRFCFTSKCAGMWCVYMFHGIMHNSASTAVMWVSKPPVQLMSDMVGWLVSWCFEPSQPLGIISALSLTWKWLQWPFTKLVLPVVHVKKIQHNYSPSLFTLPLIHYMRQEQHDDMHSG